VADIFISYWSGEQGVAYSLQKFLCELLPQTSIFMADSRTIRAGDSWLDIIKRELKESKVVLSLLSKESVKRPWINFEAGAAWIDKVLIPLCFGGLEKGMMPAPYNQLQALQLQEPRDTHRLIVDLHHHLNLGSFKEPFMGLEIRFGKSKFYDAATWFHEDMMGYHMMGYDNEE